MKKLAALLFLVTQSTIAALNTDPFVYDPSFNGGKVIEDRFASTTLSTSELGLRVVVGATGDIVSSGLVAPAYQGSPVGNFGSARYNVLGQRVPWGNPTPAYSYFDNHYLDYPNDSSGYIGWVHDVKVFNGYIYALVDIGPADGDRDVHILVFTDGGPVTNGGQLIADTPAFVTGLDEVGAALVPYCRPTGLIVNGVPVMECLIIAIANYATGSGRGIITMKRFLINSDGSLSVTNDFGISNNGAMDQAAPDSLCDAGTGCSWRVNAAAALRTNTNSPTLYLAGTIATSNTENDGFIIAVNGYDGNLSANLGHGSGIYPNYLAGSSTGVAVAAATAGAESTDVVFLATNTLDGCGQKGSVTKLLTHVTGLPGAPLTTPDFQWGNGGSRDIGGNPGSCANVYTYLTDMLLDGNRLVFVGYEDITSSIPDPLFSIVRVSDGTLTEFARSGFTALHADGSPWGGASFQSIASRGGGYYAVTGYLYDASAADATLFGTASLVSDRIFGDDFEGP